MIECQTGNEVDFIESQQTYRMELKSHDVLFVMELKLHVTLLKLNWIRFSIQRLKIINLGQCVEKTFLCNLQKENGVDGRSSVFYFVYHFKSL